MRHLYIGLLILLGCSTQDNEFQRFVGQLETLQTPISFGTIRFPEKQTDKNYEDELFQKFKYSTAYEVYGIIYTDELTIGIIYTVIGDINVPVLVTYDKKGNKIDSLNLFENASGFSFESETYEHVTFFPDRTIQVVDSTMTWTTDQTGEDRIIGTEILRIDTLIHKIGKDGKIIKDKMASE